MMKLSGGFCILAQKKKKKLKTVVKSVREI